MWNLKKGHEFNNSGSWRYFSEGFYSRVFGERLLRRKLGRPRQNGEERRKKNYMDRGKAMWEEGRSWRTNEVHRSGQRGAQQPHSFPQPLVSSLRPPYTETHMHSIQLRRCFMTLDEARLLLLLLFSSMLRPLCFSVSHTRDGTF